VTVVVFRFTVTVVVVLNVLAYSEPYVGSLHAKYVQRSTNV
jgi:hypothetical protein